MRKPPHVKSRRTFRTLLLTCLDRIRKPGTWTQKAYARTAAGRIVEADHPNAVKYDVAGILNGVAAKYDYSWHTVHIAHDRLRELVGEPLELGSRRAGGRWGAPLDGGVIGDRSGELRGDGDADGGELGVHRGRTSRATSRRLTR